MKTMKCFKGMAIAAAFVMGLGMNAHAMEVGGVKMDESTKVANQDLKLNGAGLRTWAVFKVYAAGLYLPEKKKAVPDIMALNGPRRIKLVLLRDVNNEELGQAFMDGLNANSDKAEKAKFVNQTVKMGEIFASIPKLNKGDTITSDWIPGQGMHVLVNDKRVGEVLPDIAFYNAFMRIWLGEKPVDNTLKQALLGG
ncbi:chalcone isomerase family protein [Noviherbaspirillum denitrificans]|uniref:Lipoprotein transmembrane n=1 Tax=Noviherbaspirillum denitrificans TaxID=1968433 RepID=A0A254TFY1_9BURK|nr:chalcone isomerase family protein [Noviherbaspirillum denitrificans]OWW19443.1 lipoprotein transmembrane [Noviherbaspirillum denitrificans]